MTESIAFLDELGVGSLVATLRAAADTIEGVADILLVLAGHERHFEEGYFGFKSETDPWRYTPQVDVRAKRPPRSVAAPNKAVKSSRRA